MNTGRKKIHLLNYEEILLSVSKKKTQLKSNFNDDKWWYFYEKRLKYLNNFLLFVKLEI